MQSEFIKRILDLAIELRQNNISISTDEINTAIDSILKIKPKSINILKLLLKHSLIKSYDNYILFDILFEKYFPEFFGKEDKNRENLKKTINKLSKEIKDYQNKINKTKFMQKLLRKEIEELNTLPELTDKQTQEVQKIKDELIDYIQKEQKLTNELNKLQNKYRKFSNQYQFMNNIINYINDPLVREKFNNKMERDNKIEQELKRDEDIVKEKLGTQRIVKTPPAQVKSEMETAHGGTERHEEVPGSISKTKPKGQKTQPKAPVPSKSRGASEGGRGGQGTGQGAGMTPHKLGTETLGPINPVLGIHSRPNANINNNALLNEIFNRYYKYGYTPFIKDLFNNKLDHLKNTLPNFFGLRVTNKNFIKKEFDAIKKQLREAIPTTDYSDLEKREIYIELLNRINNITSYDYKKILFKKSYFKKETRTKININKLNFKEDLNSLAKSDPLIFKLVIKQLQSEIQRLAYTFKNKKSRLFKKSKKGTLDVKQTIDYNFRLYGKNIVELKYKKPKLKKSNLFVFCDVSGSVYYASQLFYLFIETCRSLFSKFISYIFVDHISPVNKLSDLSPPYPHLGTYSNMRIAFYELAQLNIPNDFSVIILSDCRNNYKDEDENFDLPPSFVSLKKVRDNVKNIIIFNPEPRDSWNSEDSQTSDYINYSKVPIFEFYNIDSLKHSISQLEKIF